MFSLTWVSITGVWGNNASTLYACVAANTWGQFEPLSANVFSTAATSDNPLISDVPLSNSSDITIESDVDARRATFIWNANSFFSIRSRETYTARLPAEDSVETNWRSVRCFLCSTFESKHEISSLSSRFLQERNNLYEPWTLRVRSVLGIRFCRKNLALLKLWLNLHLAPNVCRLARTSSRIPSADAVLRPHLWSLTRSRLVWHSYNRAPLCKTPINYNDRAVRVNHRIVCTTFACDYGYLRVQFGAQLNRA